MSLINKFFSPRSVAKVKPTPLAEYFLDLLGRPDFPLTLAQDAFTTLRKTAKSQQELYEFMLEDIINISIYATFYEEIFKALHQNPKLAQRLVEKFAEDETEREMMISTQAQNHFNFILNDGICQGCSSCEHHSDVKELLVHWAKADMDYILDLYMGMQTIQFAMEHIIFDVISVSPQVCQIVDSLNIQKFRAYVYEYTQENS